GDYPSFRFASGLLSLRGNRIDLIDEDDGRSVLLRILEHLPKSLLRFSVIPAHDFGAIDVEKLGFRFPGHGACEQRLPRSGRTMQEHPLGRIDAESLKQDRMFER